MLCDNGLTARILDLIEDVLEGAGKVSEEEEVFPVQLGGVGMRFYL
jgi:hypothetical protein